MMGQVRADEARAAGEQNPIHAGDCLPPPSTGKGKCGVASSRPPCQIPLIVNQKRTLIPKQLPPLIRHHLISQIFPIFRMAVFAAAGMAFASARGMQELAFPPGPRDNFFDASFRIRKPGQDSAAGVLVLVPGTDGDARPWIESKHWQEFADRHRLALVGCHFRGDGVEAYDLAAGGSGVALLRALSQAGLSQDRPGPSLLFFGHSAGAQFAFQFARWKPERIMAYAVIKGGGYAHDDNEALPAAPALILAGEHDEAGRRRSAARLWEVLRLQGHPACLLLERGQDHGLGDSVRLAQAFFADVLTTGSPSSALWQITGGVEDGGVRPSRPQDTHDPTRVWLPGSATARAWQAAHRPLRRADLAQAADASPPSLRVEPSQVNFGDLAPDQTAVTLPFSPRPDPHPDGARWKLASASPHVRVTQDQPGRPHWRIQIDAASLPWGHAHGTLWLTALGTPLAAEVPVRAYLTGPWQPTPRSLYFGVMPAARPSTLKLKLQPHSPSTKPWQRLECSGPVPLDVRKLEEGSSIVLEATPRPGAHRGRFTGEIRLWMGEGSGDRFLRVPYFGLVEK
jgi:pimeloyl-ACP methyl ester carboxylesterase